MEEKQSRLLVACQWSWYKDEAERLEGRAGKLAQQQQQPPQPKQMGMEKTARESRCLKGG